MRTSLLPIVVSLLLYMDCSVQSVGGRVDSTARNYGSYITNQEAAIESSVFLIDLTASKGRTAEIQRTNHETNPTSIRARPEGYLKHLISQQQENRSKHNNAYMPTYIYYIPSSVVVLVEPLTIRIYSYLARPCK